MKILLKILKLINIRISKFIGFLWDKIPVREQWELQTQFEKQMDREIKWNQDYCQHHFIKGCDKCGIKEKDVKTSSKSN